MKIDTYKILEIYQYIHIYIPKIPSFSTDIKVQFM